MLSQSPLINDLHHSPLCHYCCCILEFWYCKQLFNMMSRHSHRESIHAISSCRGEIIHNLSIQCKVSGTVASKVALSSWVKALRSFILALRMADLLTISFFTFLPKWRVAAIAENIWAAFVSEVLVQSKAAATSDFTNATVPHSPRSLGAIGAGGPASDSDLITSTVVLSDYDSVKAIISEDLIASSLTLAARAFATALLVAMRSSFRARVRSTGPINTSATLFPLSLQDQKNRMRSYDSLKS